MHIYRAHPIPQPLTHPLHHSVPSVGHRRMQGGAAARSYPCFGSWLYPALSHTPSRTLSGTAGSGLSDGPRPVSHTTQQHIGPEGTGQLVFPFLAAVHRSVCLAMSGGVTGLEQWRMIYLVMCVWVQSVAKQLSSHLPFPPLNPPPPASSFQLQPGGIVLSVWVFARLL